MRLSTLGGNNANLVELAYLEGDLPISCGFSSLVVY